LMRFEILNDWINYKEVQSVTLIQI
jgi:hypothetical protein